MSSINPSTFQVNEGDSLTTTLSGFTPGSTLYFKVTGRGINKKDFASGGVKGRVQADSNGVATISHSLRADKATEGDESFAIQVFSDKKMRNLLGESDAVTVIDTSVKAVKAAKGGGKAGGVAKDSVTGLYWEVDGIGRLDNDKTRRINYNQAQKAINGFLDAGFENDSRPAEDYDLQIEVEFSSRRLLVTTADANGELSRSVMTGQFNYDKNRLTSARVDQIASYTAYTQNLEQGGIIEEYPGGRTIRDTKNYFEFFKALSDTGEITSSFSSSQWGQEGDKGRFTSYDGGRFFYDGWESNPFNSNLV